MPPEFNIPDWLPFEDIGYFALYFVTLLDGANIPFTPIEIFLGLAGYLAAIGEVKFLPALVVTVLGNLTGHIFSYTVGRLVGRSFFAKYGKYLLVTPERLERAEHYANKFGPTAALLFRFLPGLRTMGSILLGALRMPLWIFLLMSLPGILIWNTLLMAIGYYFGTAFAEHAVWIVPAFILIIAGGFAAAAIAWYRKAPHEHKPMDKH